jgi:hypothetical protein
MRLEWSENPENCAGGSVATGRVSHAGQVEVVMTQTKQNTLAHQVVDREGGDRQPHKTSQKPRKGLIKRRRSALIRKRTSRRMEAPLEGGQGPEGAVVSYTDGRSDRWVDGWIDGWMDG